VNGIRGGAYDHSDQDWMNAAVSGARKKQVGKVWVWDRDNSLSDVSPLCGATAAIWALEVHQPEPEQFFAGAWR
jgi:hypothetical protein